MWLDEFGHANIQWGDDSSSEEEKKTRHQLRMRANSVWTALHLSGPSNIDEPNYQLPISKFVGGIPLTYSPHQSERLADQKSHINHPPKQPTNHIPHSAGRPRTIDPRDACGNFEDLWMNTKPR